MRKFSILILFFLLSSEAVYPQDKVDIKNFHLKVRGEAGSILGVVRQKKDFRKKVNDDNTISQDENNKNMLSSNGALKLYADYLDGNRYGYGTYMKLNSSASKSHSGSDIAQEIKIYLQNKLGRFEVGATSPAIQSLLVNPYDAAGANGGLSGDSISWLNGIFAYHGNGYNNIRTTYNNTFLTEPKLLLGFDSIGKSNKINYIAPTINGVSFALSFTPDSSAKGVIGSVKKVAKTSRAPGFKNIIQPGIKYERDINKNISFATAVVSEFGRAKPYKYDAGTIARKDLAAWQVGAKIRIYHSNISTAYGSNGQSGSRKDDRVVGAQYLGDYWCVGYAYNKDKFSVSTNYSESRRAGYIFGNDINVINISSNNKEVNKFAAFSVGADVKTMEGFTPFVEYSRFKFKRNGNFTIGDSSMGFSNGGHVVLMGTKLHF